MEKIYFMSEESEMGNCAGSKARNDLEKIFKKADFIKLSQALRSNEKRTFVYLAQSFLSAMRVKRRLSKLKEQIVFFQYPVSKGVVLNDVIKKIAKNNKVVFFVHDINYLRNENESGREEEIAFLNCAHAIICHNSSMITKLKADGVTVQNLINLEIFDYLLFDGEESTPKYGRDIVYAGNLNKGGFIGKLKENQDKLDFVLHLVGINYDGEDLDKVKFEGSYTPEELVNNLSYSYGLVWDSLTPDNCDGVLGYYTQFNNPHKLSLYMSAGLPVIVWSKSAIAKFVVEHEVGFVVDSLYDVNARLDEISLEQYQIFIDNIAKIKSNVREGYYAKRAIDSAIALCKTCK